MILIKIDRDSIKKNPNAGNTRTSIAGRVYYRFEFQGDIEDEFKSDGLVVTSWEKDLDSMITEGYVKDEETFKELIARFNGDHRLSTNIEQDIKTLDHFPESEYLYEWAKETKVKCNKCGKEYLLDNLIIKEYEESGDEYAYCPEDWNYLGRIEYEDISDVEKEMLPQ